MSETARVGIFPDPYIQDKWHTEGNQVLRFWAEATKDCGYCIEGVPLEKLVDVDALGGLGLDILHLHWPETIGSHFSHLAKQKANWPVLHFLKNKSLLERWLSGLERLGLPLVLQLHDLRAHQHSGIHFIKGHLDMFLRKKLYQQSRAVLTQEHSCLPCISALYGSKLFGVTPLGDFTLFHGSSVGKASARKNLGLDIDDKIFLCIGTARPNRNPQRSIQVIDALKKPDVKLLVAGMNNHPYEKYATGGNIKFFHGMVANDVVRDLFCAADFLINDAAEYLTSAVLRCAMSYGLPVITYRYGAAIDMVEGAAIYIEPGVAGLQHAVNKALAMGTDQVAVMKQSAESRNAERTWERAGCEFGRIYSLLIK